MTMNNYVYFNLTKTVLFVGFHWYLTFLGKKTFISWNVFPFFFLITTPKLEVN